MGHLKLDSQMVRPSLLALPHAEELLWSSVEPLLGPLTVKLLKTSPTMLSPMVTKLSLSTLTPLPPSLPCLGVFSLKDLKVTNLLFSESGPLDTQLLPKLLLSLPSVGTHLLGSKLLHLPHLLQSP